MLFRSLTEKGTPVRMSCSLGTSPVRLTGSQPDGRAFTDAGDHTCRNYTSSAAEGSVQVGHFDRTGRVPTALSWNSAHGSRGCGQANLVSTGGAGLLYCFAVR